MFGLMELDQAFNGARFALGIRNSHDKTMRLAMTVGIIPRVRLRQYELPRGLPTRTR